MRPQRVVQSGWRGRWVLWLVIAGILALGCNLTAALNPTPTERVIITQRVAITRRVIITRRVTITRRATTTHTLTPTATERTAPPPTPSVTPTVTPAVTVPTSSPAPSPTATAPAATAPAATATKVPPTPTPTCNVLPEGAFLAIWQDDPARQAALGCPTSNHPRIKPAAWEVSTSYQPYEHGAMVWSDKIGWYEQPVIYVLYENGTYERYDDTYTSGDPTAGETPPSGLVRPLLGFGKVWMEHPPVRATLGWATDVEMPGPGRFQLFTGGAMIWLSQRGETVVVLNDPATYDVIDTPAC